MLVGLKTKLCQLNHTTLPLNTHFITVFRFNYSNHRYFLILVPPQKSHFSYIGVKWYKKIYDELTCTKLIKLFIFKVKK